ncbi:MAG TPA: hypothetical protein VMV46_12385 [Thermoanaerobaculia bacterium]|nr:hypothetical protein [Thermoanaerobaculia bacterium]
MSDAYDTVELRPSWLGCSLLSFGGLVLFAVALPLLIRTTGWEAFRWIRVAALVIPGASLLGTVSGAIALRRGANRSLAGLALILNFAVFASCVAAVAITILR